MKVCVCMPVSCGRDDGRRRSVGKRSSSNEQRSTLRKLSPRSLFSKKTVEYLTRKKLGKSLNPLALFRVPTLSPWRPLGVAQRGRPCMLAAGVGWQLPVEG